MPQNGCSTFLKSDENAMGSARHCTAEGNGRQSCLLCALFYAGIKLIEIASKCSFCTLTLCSSAL